MSAQTQAREHYRRQQLIAAAAVVATRDALKKARADVAALELTISRYQAASASAAVSTFATEAGTQPVVDVTQFVGTSALGFPLEAPLQVLVDRLVQQYGRTLKALTPAATVSLDRFVASEVQDAGRSAGQVQIVETPIWDNYVRVLNLPSCSRCAVLAGRIYRDLDAFRRHFLCDCVQWPVESWSQARDEGLVFSFDSAFRRGQVTGLSEADAQAIRDGANPGQVVSATRGTSEPGITAASVADVFGTRLKVTSEGTTKRSAWRKANPASKRPYRLRPEAIYAVARDREEARRLLRVYGFVTTP